ncbi:MAG TPA: hypothetical protein VGK33_01700 [Chloroflexota bacterium]
MPKIDWFDSFDDQPRWEPRVRRDRFRRDPRDRRTRLEQIIAMTSLPPVTQDPPVRRPLHLIWGAPVRPKAEDDAGPGPSSR